MQLLGLGLIVIYKSLLEGTSGSGSGVKLELSDGDDFDDIDDFIPDEDDDEDDQDWEDRGAN